MVDGGRRIETDGTKANQHVGDGHGPDAPFVMKAVDRAGPSGFGVLLWSISEARQSTVNLDPRRCRSLGCGRKFWRNLEKRWGPGRLVICDMSVHT
ncbi:hypothetical protein CCHR01_13976 [Colletotrichum chrysophilum]|uniref:Uncharacterized protein n=1 Tax=Colletotrichum chrysophilum TaxID=1836956 RepID=A0AAD9EG13_9PEZI|nr:hypothetical protein CCHR01_13976 [Colletotrichum chrysophilum]